MSRPSPYLRGCRRSCGHSVERSARIRAAVPTPVWRSQTPRSTKVLRAPMSLPPRQHDRRVGEEIRRDALYLELVADGRRVRIELELQPEIEQLCVRRVLVGGEAATALGSRVAGGSCNRPRSVTRREIADECENRPRVGVDAYQQLAVLGGEGRRRIEHHLRGAEDGAERIAVFMSHHREKVVAELFQLSLGRDVATHDLDPDRDAAQFAQQRGMSSRWSMRPSRCAPRTSTAVASFGASACWRGSTPESRGRFRPRAAWTPADQLASLAAPPNRSSAARFMEVMVSPRSNVRMGAPACSIIER